MHLNPFTKFSKFEVKVVDTVSRITGKRPNDTPNYTPLIQF